MDRNSLSQQAAQLQRSILKREQRRVADKAQRHEAAEAAGEYNGSYDTPASKRQATGGLSQVQKLSEISAQLSRPVEVFRCDLCQVRTGGAVVGQAGKDTASKTTRTQEAVIMHCVRVWERQRPTGVRVHWLGFSPNRAR